MSRKKVHQWLVILLATAMIIFILNRLSAIVKFRGYPLRPIGEATAQASQAMPSQWTECMPTDLPTSNWADAQLLGEHQGEHSLFAIWECQAKNRAFLWVNSLYGGDGGACGHGFDSRYESFMSPDYITLEDAQALSILLYEYKIETAGGLNNFQALINETLAAPGPAYFAPEFIYAMRHLGVTLPDADIQVTGPNNKPPNVRQP